MSFPAFEILFSQNRNKFLQNDLPIFPLSMQLPTSVHCGIPFTLRTHELFLYSELMAAYTSVEGENLILVN